MEYGGSYPLGWNQSPSEWRERQYQLYQESLEEEEEDPMSGVREEMEMFHKLITELNLLWEDAFKGVCGENEK